MVQQSVNKVAVIGYGITGQSCATFLLNQDIEVSVFVSDLETVNVDNAKDQNRKLIAFFRLDDDTDLSNFDYAVVSPGIDLKHPALTKALKDGVELISEIELFSRHNSAPVIAVTGSNGKSTVVDMLHKGLVAANINTGLGGNIGTSAISLLEGAYSLIVLEISSFQLELTYSLKPKIACVLNVTEDHIDRHGDVKEYAAVKRRIYEGAEICIVNRDDAATHANKCDNVFSFGHSRAMQQNQSCNDEEGIWIDGECVIAQHRLLHQSQHNLLNLQVVLLIAKHILNSEQQVLFTESLLGYTGLPHRFETCFKMVNNKNMPVTFIDDSKATNPGATVSAINSVDAQSDLVLIVGGDSKQADLHELASLVATRVDLLLCLGKDADLFMPMSNHSHKFDDLEALVAFAIKQIQDVSRPTVVMLSPACASIDMFKNFKQRGQQFQQYVRRCA
ncbi:MAG: UDP-N-acetylmuramoyl-L-alanine--D-glutamate ligase [Pseudomonadota bacterium]